MEPIYRLRRNSKMLKIKFQNLKKVFHYINRLKTTPVNYSSIFNSIKKMVLFFILYIFITGITVLIVIFSINKNQEIIAVPKIVNLPFYKAYQVLYSDGFNVDIELKYFNNIQKGIVAFQSIKEQKKVKKGRKIKLIVSLGPKYLAKESPEQEYQLNSYVINFKLPEVYEKARVKILISDEKEADKLVFDEIIFQTNKLKIPVKIHGQGIKKIYINDDLFIEKDFE